jgi:hypothetical protein
MPLKFIVTREDMLRGKILDPGWYKVRVSKATQEPSSAGDSTNTWIHFTVLGGPEQKDKSKIVETPLRRCFSEKAPGFIVPYLVACGAKVNEDGGEFDVEKSVGKELMVYVKTGMYENKPQNNVEDFKAIAA